VRLLATDLPRVFVASIEWRRDERGAFGRAWTGAELRAGGLSAAFVQMNVSRTTRAGTLRGLHYQLAPAAEAKFLRCTRGAIVDVCVDVRAGSPTLGRWVSIPLNADSDESIYIGEGIAHGFMTLADETEVQYASTHEHDPDRERGIRWDDPGIAIAWPRIPTEISTKDRSWPDFDRLSAGSFS
jgi:dTDP-4-dehydrorhamnose 3,5-epimerase